MRSPGLKQAYPARIGVFFPVVFFILLVGGIGESSGQKELPVTNKGGDVITLSISFQDGFADDKVILKVNAETVFDQQHVTTKLLTGLAESFEVEIEAGQVRIDVHVPKKEIRKTITIEASADTYLGISLVGGRIDHIVRDAPFFQG